MSFAAGASSPLLFAQQIRNLLSFQPVSFRRSIVNVDIGVSFRDQAPKPQPLVILHNGQLRSNRERFTVDRDSGQVAYYGRVHL
jgi:hypothetical protein